VNPKILSFTSTLIEKSQDFRYFGLMASLCLLADIALSVTTQKPLLHIEYSDFRETIALGGLVLFLAAFSFYLSFFIPLIKQVVFISTFLVPYKVKDILGLYPEYKNDPETRKHFLNLSDLKALSIRNDNKVAYEVYKLSHQENEKFDNLCFFCLSLLVAAIANISLTTNIKGSISQSIYTIIREFSLVGVMLQLVLSVLFLYCFYLGVIVYCGLELRDREKLYMYDHGIEVKS
jgi:hypothetical protein